MSCRLVRDGTPEAWAGCGGLEQRTLTVDGTYRLESRQADAAGNVSPVGKSGDYLYDGTAPAKPSVVAPASPSSTRQPSWTFSTEARAVASCRVVQGANLTQDWRTCTSPHVVDLAGLADGAYVLQVRQVDLAGNTSPVGESAQYALDTTAPDLPVVTGPSGPAPATSPTFTWTAETGTGSLCQLVLDGIPQGTDSPAVLLAVLAAAAHGRSSGC